MSKKEKRQESKKRKQEALLELLTMEEPCAKKVKTDDNDEKNSTSDVPQSETKTAEEIRAALKKRQKESMVHPKFFLTLDKMVENAGSQRNVDSVTIYPMDIQHLILYAIQGQLASNRPRWGELKRVGKLSHVAVLVVDALSSVDVSTYPDSFNYFTENFKMRVEMISPSQYGRTFAEDLFSVPLSNRQLMLKTSSKDNNLSFRIAKTDANGTASISLKASEDETSCLDLLLDEEKMKLEGYPMPLLNSDSFKRYKFSKAVYTPPNEKSPMFAIDCEMVKTKAKSSELAWIAVVDENLKCVYQTLVKPRGFVVDYMTRFSGVTAELLQGVTTTLADVQQKLRTLLPADAILVGQSLGNDLNAMEIFHPYVIDTSVIYNLSGNPARKPKLKDLASQFLRRSIQEGTSGHDPREDALATMELILLKLKCGLKFGNVLNGWILSKDFELVNGSNTRTETSTKNEITPANNQNSASPPTAMEMNDSESPEDPEQQQKFFFHRGSNFQCLFGIAKRCSKSVAVAGFGSDMPEDADILPANSDKGVAKRSREAVDNHFMVCSQFNGVAEEFKNSDRCSRCLQRSFSEVTKQVKKVVTSLPTKTMVVVVFSGRADANGLCFVQTVKDSTQPPNLNC